jgi:Asp-tRNA(Asn)/Glu-tRNA(Gln) amidotransferase A subunit family amidase
VTKFAEFVPERDSVVVERLRGAGAIVIGKTSTPEFALLGETRNPLVGETRNPWDTSRTTGGSSGGSAAAVAAGVVALALGSDSAGSIPAPAAMCGVFGMKPTRGLVPVWPDPGDARLFLDPGPLAASVADGRAVIEAVAGPDARDPTSFRPALEPAPERPLRIAWNPDWGALAVDRQVRSATAAAAEALASLGHALEEAHPALEGDPFAIATPLLGADLWTLFEREQIEEADLSEEAWAEALLLGCPTSTEYVRALNRLSWHRRAMDGFFEDFDLMLSPATAVTAFPAEQPPARIDAREVDQRWNVFMPFQVPCNLAGMPTASLPCGVDDAGLPIGLQVSGPRGSDLCVLSLCEEFERLRPWPLAGTGKII